MKTLSGLPGKAVFRVMVTIAVVKCGHARTNKTVPVRVVMSSDLKTVQVSTCSEGAGGRVKLPEKKGRGVRPAAQSPFPIYV